MANEAWDRQAPRPLSICYALTLQLGLMIAAVFAPALLNSHPCATCHPKETNGFAQSAMAHSMRTAANEPEGSFQHPVSGAQFTIHNTSSGPWQSVHKGESDESFPIRYVIGSGTHATGYLIQVGDHLFQSPLSYYTNEHIWDMAPGYEQSMHPDFSRPVTAECLFCHSDKPRPIANTLNSYRSPPFEGGAIQCDRCHGNTEVHLRKPLRGTIINPAKLPQPARDSICEQCHLTGEVRIPNPGKALTDFQPGQASEEVYTVYVARQNSEKKIKVVSQAEQLALSACARNSNHKLWCGTCHNPHEALAKSAAYYRAKCLTCHSAGLPVAHAAPDRDCISCHMPRLPAKDGGHTAFTNHRITRLPEEEAQPAAPNHELVAWREPIDALRQRNLALALVTIGMQNQEPNQVVRGYRILNRLETEFSSDPVTLTTLGTILLTAKQPVEAILRFERAVALRPEYPPYKVNLAAALLETGNAAEATRRLQRAIELDPMLEKAILLLRRAYLAQGQNAQAEELMSRYRAATGFATK